MKRYNLFLLSIIFNLSTPVLSHEFWVSPISYDISIDKKIEAHLRVGQNFRGSTYFYNTGDFRIFQLLLNNKNTPVLGNLGDSPPLSMQISQEGLAIIIYETKNNQVKYSEWQKFKDFVIHKDLSYVLDQHIKRGIPRTNFIELYTRYAKSLVAVGHGNGEDREVGLKTEIIALRNPYTSSMEYMPLLLLLDGKPKPFAQIEVFEKSFESIVTTKMYKTDSFGKVSVPIKQNHEYLIDSVTMVPENAKDFQKDPVWRSLWASLTFKVLKTSTK
jgi:uncharacterized GH25 family protein